jgi:hypothetical protein
MAAGKAPLLPFQKLAASFGATATTEAREAGTTEVFRSETPLPGQGEYRTGSERASLEVELRHGAAPCLVVRAHEEEAGPVSGQRKNVMARMRARLVYPTLSIQRASSLDRLNTLFALRFDVRTGDPAFDRAVTIAADLSDEVLAQAFGTKEARTAVLDILAAGFTVHFEERALRAELIAPTEAHLNPATLSPIITALATLVAHVPRVDAGGFTKRPQLGRFITAIILVTGLVAAGALAPGTLDDPGVPVRELPRLLIPLPAVAPGLLAGSAAFVLAYLLLRWQLKRKNTSTDLPLVLALFVVLASLGVGVLDAGNRLLDEAPLVTHKAKVASKDVAKSRKSGAANEWSIVVPSWRPGVTELELIISPDMHRDIRPGDTVLVTTHPGYFGWEWGAVIEQVAGGQPATDDDDKKRRAPPERGR